MTRPYYNKKHRNNNTRIFLIVGIVAISVFIITMIFYPEIKSNTDNISDSTKNYISTINESSDPKIISMQIHKLINQQRVSNGKSALSWDDSLSQIAILHSNDMLNNDYFDHVDLQGNNPTQRIQSLKNDCLNPSENIAWVRGYHSDQIAGKMVSDWMNSPEHRTNILSSTSTSEGIGIAYDGDHAIATEDFC